MRTGSFCVCVSVLLALSLCCSAACFGGAFVGRPAPPFNAEAVVEGKFQNITLSQFRGKYFVLFFYPLDFSFVCPTEIMAFNDHLNDFREIGCEVAAVSVDSKYSHLAWYNTPRSEGGLGRAVRLPLISDITKDIARDYGVRASHCALFIINPEGIVRQITINDLPVGRSVLETLRLVRAFQHADVHGEVCPAGWHPGDATLVPNVQESKQYFQSALWAESVSGSA